MQRMPFERPTDDYDEKISSIDEQLCALIKQRKDISSNNPGFPPAEYISNWASKFGLYEELLHSLFGTLGTDEEFFKPPVEPKGFMKHVPILQSVEQDGRFYSITFMRQYKNASVVHLNVDWDATNESPEDHEYAFLKLFIGDSYNCRMGDGVGSTGHSSHSFIVTPPLPDDISAFDFIFKEYNPPFRDSSVGRVIHFTNS